MERNKLSREDILAQIGEGWTLSEAGDAIEKQFTFKNFRKAFAFMAEIATYAEKLDHHPEWTNVYNRVQVSLSTHDVGGVTALDIKLAKQMDAAV